MEDLSGQEETQKVFGAWEITMKNHELKKLLHRIPIPEPDEKARERTLNKAMEAFDQLKKADGERIKGFSLLNRLRRKKLGGCPLMRKSFAVTAGIAFSLMLLIAVMIPNFSAYRGAPTTKDTYNHAPAAKHDVAPPTVRSRPVSGTFERGFPEGKKQLGHPSQEYVGRDHFEIITPNPVKLVKEEPVSTFSIDVDTASYAFVRRALHTGVLPQKDAVRIEELINYFTYEYPLPRDRSAPFRPTVTVIPTPWNSDTKLIHIGIKGFDIVPGKKQRSNLVFLIDVSGSMKSPDKLPLLKNAFGMLLESLDPQDVVAIVVYAGAAGTVLEPTPVQEKGRILATLDSLSAGGSTAGGEGIRQAYALAEANFDPQGVNRVILATDGDFNVGIRNPEELKGFVERKRRSGVYLTVLGFGQGNYNDALMQKLAQNGNGTAAYIDTLNEARKVLVDEANATLFPIANDVKIQIEFNPARVAEYRLIGYETRLLRREDFKNDLVDAGDIGAGHSITALYEITPADSNARLIDELRYGTQEPVGGDRKGEKTDEYAFLKIRFKLPGEKASRVIETPIGLDVEYTSLAKVPVAVRFASAVAAFGQLLRGDPYVKDFTYQDVIVLAEPARGRDSFGLRTEFLNLVRLAMTARAMGNT